MKPRLLKYLACPVCASAFTCRVEVKDGSEIMEGELMCARCKKKYPVRRGVPRILPDALSKTQKDTAGGFGYQWHAFSTLNNLYEKQFLDWLHPVKPDFFRNKVILEGGCGKGRHTYYAAKYGCYDIIGVDLSDAVDVAYQNTGKMHNVHIVQTDIYNLPFHKRFDYAFSIGVLHHLPDPERGFLSLASKVRHGGAISAWVYGKEGNGWLTSFVNPIRIKITSRMPKMMLYYSSWVATALLYMAVKGIYKPCNTVEAFSFLKKILFYNDYMFYISKFGFKDIHNIVFDHLVAPEAYYISEQEFERWFIKAGIREKHITWHNKNSWRGFGRIY